MLKVSLSLISICTGEVLYAPLASTDIARYPLLAKLHTNKLYFDAVELQIKV